LSIHPSTQKNCLDRKPTMKSIEQNFDVPTEMRAVVLDGTGFEHLHLRKIPTPRPSPRQMLARVDAAGICTSLIKLVEQGSDHQLVYEWDLTRWPLILGDEGAVTLVEVGEQLRGSYHPGERYVVQPAVDHEPINHRERYREGGRGIQKVAVSYTLGGHLAEYILITEEILEADCLLPIPDPVLPYSHAATSEPISCVISAQDHHMHLTQNERLAPRSVLKGLKPGGVTVIIGAGAMGRMHVDLSMSYAPRAVIVADFIDERLERTQALFGARAKQLGIALFTINPSKADVKEFVGEQTEHHGADDAIIAVGSRQAIESAGDYLGIGAVLNLFGGLKKGEGIVGLDTIAIHYKAINVTGSSGGSPWDIARALELMASGQINPAVHITRIGDLEHAIDLLKMVKAQQIDGKAIVYPHRRTKEIRTVQSWTAEDEQVYLEGLTEQ
jgi:threonine dehydrogenase-like Zn-dependent dehydrogenase